MSTNHTPEPWQMRGMSIVDSEGKGIVDTSNAIARELANKTRIVACVNALAGLNPEAVPEAIAALREAVNWFEGNQSTQSGGTMQVITAARAALAKLDGVQCTD